MNYKKIIMLTLIFVFCAIIIPMNVEALQVNQEKTVDLFNITTDYSNPDNWDLCSNTEAKPTLKFIGNLLRLAFIAVPIVLIIIGSIDFVKATLAKNDDDIKKAQSAFIKRIIACVLIFFVPVITKIIYGTVLDAKPEIKDSQCLTCILDPDQC